MQVSILKTSMHIEFVLTIDIVFTSSVHVKVSEIINRRESMEDHFDTNGERISIWAN